MATIKFLAFGCVHFPFEDAAGVDWLIDAIRRHKPRVVVNLGDTIDTQSLSGFAKANLTDLSDEFDAAEAFCRRVNKVAPDARKVWMMGNHEQRIWREEHAHLTTILDHRKHIPSSQGWKHFEYAYRPENAFTLGQVTFAHGFHTSDTACKKEAMTLGVENGLYIHAHTHRPHHPHRINYGTLRTRYWIANTGCYIRDDINYMRTKDDSLWGQGYVVGEVDTKRRYDGATNWKAELVVRKMNWEK